MAVQAKKHIKTSRHWVFETFVLIAASLTTLAMLSRLLVSCHYGLDFADESFYLVWMSNPWIYDTSLTSFGFIYHPLYLLVGGDIVLLRQCNITISFILAWTLFFTFFKGVVNVSEPDFRLRNLRTPALAAIMAAGATVISSRIPTPSYNSLAFQALLLAGTGVLMTDQSSSRISTIGWTLIGVAGWLAFMAKPSTAAALAIVLFLSLLLAGKVNLRLLGLSLSLATALLIASAWIIDGSLTAFMERFSRGLEMYKQLGSGHTIQQIIRVDTLELKKGHLPKAVPVIAIEIFFWFSLVFVSLKNKGSVLLGSILTFVLVVLGFFIAAGVILPAVNLSSIGNMLILTVPIGIFLTIVTIMRRLCFSGISRKQWSLGLCFILFPYVFAFGTAANYLRRGSDAGIFLILAILAVMKEGVDTKTFGRMLLTVVVCFQFTAVLIFNETMERPYRQPEPIRLNKHVTTVGVSASQLVLSNDFSRYFNQAKWFAQSRGFIPGTPMIDLSGRGPGVSFGIGAKALGQPWMVGNYQGSERAMHFVLDRVACAEIAQAWLLLEPDGPWALRPEILQKYGIDYRKDYIPVGTMDTPIGKGGYQKIYRQTLWKPVRSIQTATMDCCRQRSSQPEAIQQRKP